MEAIFAAIPISTATTLLSAVAVGIVGLYAIWLGVSMAKKASNTAK